MELFCTLPHLRRANISFRGILGYHKLFKQKLYVKCVRTCVCVYIYIYIYTHTYTHPPSFLYNGYRVFPGVKRSMRGVDHPPAISAEVKERVELYLYSSSGPSWPVIG